MSLKIQPSVFGSACVYGQGLWIRTQIMTPVTLSYVKNKDHAFRFQNDALSVGINAHSNKWLKGP